jgi:cytochrome c553
MSPIAQGLERADLLPLAQYFSQKTWPNLQQPPAAGDVAAEAERANTSVVCTSCHQGGFKGSGSQPRLHGQVRAYLEKTTLDFSNSRSALARPSTNQCSGVQRPTEAGVSRSKAKERY